MPKLPERKRKKLVPPPEAAKGDILHGYTKALVGAIPAVGSVLAEIFDQLVAPPVRERVNQWRRDVSAGLQDLEGQFADFRWQSAVKEERFVSCFLFSIHTASRTHNRKKLFLLRNAVLNSALKLAPNEEVELAFLRLIDDLSPAHLEVLQFLQNSAPKPGDWYEDTSGNLGKVLGRFRSTPGLTKFLLDELNSRGLIQMKRLEDSGGYRSAYRLLPISGEFLLYLQSPLLHEAKHSDNAKTS